MNGYWCALYLLVITYDLNKLRHTSKVKEKTIFNTLSNKLCTFENNDYIILDCVSEDLKVSLEGCSCLQ